MCVRVNIHTHVVYNLQSVLKSYLWTCNDGPFTAVSTRDDDTWWKGVTKCKTQSEDWTIWGIRELLNRMPDLKKTAGYPLCLREEERRQSGAEHV